MMYAKFISAVFASILLLPLAHAASDSLGNHSLAMRGPNSQDVLNQLTGNIKSVFQNYVPVVDADSRIVSPLRVTGSSTNPEMSMSVEKCMFGFCKTVDLHASVSLKEAAQNGCDRFYTLNADLTRSSRILTDVYDSLDVNICYTRAADGSGSLAMTAGAHQASGYSRGTIQKQIFEMLKMQIPPITKALDVTLNGR